ncbi:putative porin [Cochleicola gelatinilyticus]|uniref:Porin n=1 Tax=Cochleicola gelatinilyticus TaxID=1763537 RepID=A0A167IHU6_9FLAO|nr:putative porin [Cochleicola gelatinilyticus]OAB79666.1 hypothetical protein ULVI_02645 [Cochleicola gelatinilyticus]
MNRTLLVLFLIFVAGSVYSQEDEGEIRDAVPTEKIEKPPIDLYKIISADRDTTFLDTTLSIKKDYKFNYLRKDAFELLPFSNVGQTYNSLAYSFDRLNLKPLFAGQAQHFAYLEIEDMRYFNVPTPLTELYYRTAFEQGQQLDATFTINTSEQFNFFIGYKGVRSLGAYQNILTSTGNFRFTTNYHTKDNRYNIRAHVAAQDNTNEQNGGLADDSLPLFINDDPDFDDRGRLDVQFEDGENKLEGLRFYGIHEYELISKKDSTGYNVLAIGNEITYEDKYYQYKQAVPFADFGESYQTANLKDKVKLEDFNTKAFVRFDNSLLGNLRAHIGYTDYNYGYDAVLIFDEGRINNRLKGTILEAGAEYRKVYKGFQLYGKGAINVAGDFDGNYLQGAASYRLDPDNVAEASITVHSVAPNFNFLLFQSDYVNYNWQNNFENVKTQELKFDLNSKKIAAISVSYTGIDDYTYFGVKENDSTPTPQQSGDRVDYLKVKVGKEFRYGKFGLANTIMYQKVTNGTNVFKVPELITRNTLYYQDELFKKALFLQAGVTFKYFTEYEMNDYDPVLGEFFVQTGQQLGGFPLVDVFFNAKVRQTRIYFKYEHLNSLFNTTNNYFTAPGYPYRDASFRFGLVWDFFL